MNEPPAPNADDPTAPISRRYRSVNGPDGDLVIFDGAQRNRWIQSDLYVALGFNR